MNQKDKLIITVKEKIIFYIDNWENFQHINLRDYLQKEFKISKNYLSNIFHYHNNESIREFHNRTRIEKAKKLLIEGSSCKEIMFKLGFCSESHLCTMFKSISGIKMNEYRKIQKENKYNPETMFLI